MLRIIYRPRSSSGAAASAAAAALVGAGGGVLVPPGAPIPLAAVFSSSANDIELKIIHVNNVERVDESSRDGTTYECTRWTFDVICQYNPQATSYRGSKVGNAGSSPFQSLGEFPGDTDIAVRHFLMQKRGMLIVDMGGSSPMFESPLRGYVVDAKNGPDPEFCNIVAVHGDKTMTIHYRITTWVNECKDRTNLSPILSHRWRRYVDTDEDHFSTLVTEGQAIFRVDELARYRYSPDAFRVRLFHPVPDYCQRKDIHVEAIEDGTGVNYRFVDQELPVNNAFKSRGMTRVEAYMSSSFKMGNLATEALHAAIRTARDSAYIIAFGSFSTPLALSIATAGNVAQGAANFLPRYGTHYFVRVWGSRLSTRNDMMGQAISYIDNIQSGIRARLNCSSEIIVSQEQHGKMVEVQANFTWGLENVAIGELANIAVGGIAGAAFGAVAAFNPFNPLFGVFPGEKLRPFFTTDNITNPVPPNSGGTRGTLLEMVVSQVLSEPCTGPTRAALTPLTVNANF